jgi:hypothetical protein
MMIRQLMTVTLALAFSAPFVAHAQSDADLKNQEKQIEAQYRADQKKCTDLAGNAKDICVAQAKGSEKVAKAELQARRDNYTAEARHDLRLAKAEAAHDVAKEKCDEMAGNTKDVCLKDALAAFTRAKAEARADRKASETSKNSRDQVANTTRNAEYDAAVERCDKYAGETKSRCVADTKARFGR